MSFNKLITPIIIPTVCDTAQVNTFPQDCTRKPLIGYQYGNACLQIIIPPSKIFVAFCTDFSLLIIVSQELDYLCTSYMLSEAYCILLSVCQSVCLSVRAKNEKKLSEIDGRNMCYGKLERND